MGILNKLTGIPVVSSEHGENLDWLLEVVHWFMLLLFVGWSAYLVYTIIRYRRKRNPNASYHGVQGHATSHLEIGVILIEVILLLGFAFPLWAARVDQFPDPDVKVNAWGEQFVWNFHYAGADGKFGMTNRFLISGSNQIGLDPEDPNSMDDVVTGSLHLPKNGKVEIAVTSKDVIHNLAFNTMRIATDADPGKVNHIWFVPTRAGKSDIICGQLCGPAHGNMRAELEVLPDMKSFDAWLKEQQQFKDTPAAMKVQERLKSGQAGEPAQTVPGQNPAQPKPPEGASGQAPAVPASPATVPDRTPGPSFLGTGAATGKPVEAATPPPAEPGAVPGK